MGCFASLLFILRKSLSNNFKILSLGTIRSPMDNRSLIILFKSTLHQSLATLQNLKSFFANLSRYLTNRKN